MRKVYFNDEIVVKKVDLKSGDETIFLVVREDRVDDECERIVNSMVEGTTTSGRLFIGKEVLTLKMNYGKGYVEVGILDETREKVPLVFNFDIDLMKEHGHKGHRPFVYLLKFRDNDFEYLEEIAIRMMFTIMRLKKNEIF